MERHSLGKCVFVYCVFVYIEIKKTSFVIVVASWASRADSYLDLMTFVLAKRNMQCAES